FYRALVSRSGMWRFQKAFRSFQISTWQRCFATFDIDANGIVHVSAKDLGTGKEQSIQIQSSSGLDESEIDRMVKDAEAHAEEDKREREKIDARNNADSLVYQTEKAMKDYGDKVDASSKAAIESALADLKAVLANQSASVDEIKAKTEALQTASYKLAEEMYKNANPQGGPQAGPQGPGAGPQQGPQGPQGGADDADYEVVN
ncbi:MAG: Hsp70 family protein, partial [Spirochaetales bacterium]|nr:Hsp70 family protein [Spirochaetales bacterium]